MQLRKVYSIKALLLTGAVSAAVAVPSFSYAAKEKLDAKDLLSMSLKELTEVEVTSVSKKAEKETEAAAAIYVITQEDIRRSGATEIPELLRMAPGITVTKSGSHSWTVTARGFNDQFSNKLLVLIDGRTIYSPLFSGVIWDMQDTMLEDIERIEVIRGPGATLWGANAVNGVINIITKNAEDTEGGLATAAIGTKVDGIGGGRYGMKISDDSYVRMYAKQSAYDSEHTLTGLNAGDSWKRSQAGFRSDSQMTESGTLTVQGDAYYMNANTGFTFPSLNGAGYIDQSEGVRANGFNVLGRWDEEFATDSQASLQMYVDNAARKTGFFNDTTSTVDMDFQHVWSRWEGHEVVWGTGYRLIRSENNPASEQYSLTPRTRYDNLFNAFVQDKMPLYEKEVFLTLGSKFEHNDYTGFEVQPSARISWLPDDDQTVWASISRAVHTPSRFTDDGTQSFLIIPPGFLPVLFAAGSNRNLDSEELIAYELGYRVQPTPVLSFDVAAFYNDYSKIFTGVLGDPVVFGSYVLQPVNVLNNASAYSTGVEIASKWNVSDDWQLAGSYSYINQVFDNKGSVAYTIVGKHPRHQFNVRSSYTIMDGLELNNALYYADDLTGVAVPDYFRFDAGLTYEAMEGVEISLIGQNLFEDQHQEFSAFTFQPTTNVGRSVLGLVRVEF